MKFKDEKFIPYKFPYEHNYRSYAQFSILKDVNFEENDYYVYLVSNPFQLEHRKTTNEYSVNVAILVKNKNTKKLTVRVRDFDFKYILELNTLGKISNIGEVLLLENIDKSFSKKIYETKINLEDTTKYEILSLEDVVSRFQILKKAEAYKLDHFKDLEFYLFEVNGQKVLIPAMEILKYFYLYNYSYQKEPKSHFCQDILTPSGILNSLNILEYDSITQHYNIEINGNYAISDRYKILFFITNPKRLKFYSDIEKYYKETEKISARIPRRNVELVARVFEYKNLNLLLILNIVYHDFIFEKEFPIPFTCDFKHAKSLKNPKDENKRDPSKDIKKKIRKNKTLNVDDTLYGNHDLEYDAETQSDFKLNINCEKAADGIDLNTKRIIDNQRQQQGGRKNQDYSNVSEAPLTPKNTLGNKDEAVSMQKSEDNQSELNKNHFNLVEILHHLKKNSDFSYINEKTFKYPMILNKKGESVKRSFMFIDKMNQIRRKYYIAKLQYKKFKDIYLIELQARANGDQKSFLTIIKNSESIDTINDNYISHELIDFAQNGNRSWLSASVILKENEYLISTHRGKTTTFEEKLLQKLK